MVTNRTLDMKIVAGTLEEHYWLRMKGDIMKMLLFLMITHCFSILDAGW